MQVLKHKILLVAIVLIVINGLACFLANRFTLSLGHVLATSVMFFIFLKTSKRGSLLTTSFIFLVLSSALTPYYDKVLPMLFLHVFRLITNIFLIIYIYPKQKSIKLQNAVFYIVILLLVLLNVHLIYIIDHLVQRYYGDIDYSSMGFYAIGISHIILGFFTLKLNFSGNKNASFFVGFVALYVLADIFAIIAYTLQSDVLFLFNRTFYIFSLYCLINFARKSKTAKLKQFKEVTTAE